MAADGGCHAGASRAAPERIAARVHAQHCGIADDEADRGGEILCRHGAALAGAILDHEGVQPRVADRGTIREALMHRADIGETAAGRDDGEGCVRLAAQEEQTGMCLGRLGSPLCLGIDLEEDLAALFGILDQAVQRSDRRGDVDMAVIGQQGPDCVEPGLEIVVPVVPGQDAAGEA
nr:hypothetical protein [Bosea vaviloviae]